MNIPKIPFLVLVCVVHFALRGWAQEAYVFSLPTEGTASVYIDDATKKAVIIDGGKGAVLGRPILDGKPLMDALIDRGITSLLISCSHPHEDHAGGLRYLITEEPGIEKFDAIHFVDCGYPKAESLHVLFQKTHRNFDEAHGKKLTWQSANGEDAFAKIPDAQRGNVMISNLVYTPTAQSSAHGFSIVHRIVLKNRDGEKIIVDFDDAETSLVDKWAAFAKKSKLNWKPDIAIIPHHGSDNTNLKAILCEGSKPSQCVVTANLKNRYLHPGVFNFYQCVQAVKSENVFVTGIQGTVRISPIGVKVDTDPAVSRTRMESMLYSAAVGMKMELAKCEIASAVLTLESPANDENKACALGKLFEVYGVEPRKKCELVLMGY